MYTYIIDCLKQKYIVGFNLFLKLYLYIHNVYHNKNTKDWKGNGLGKNF